MIAAAGGGLVILLLLLLLARRRGADEEFEESILIGSQGEDTESLGDSADDTEAGMSEAAETSFLSEFSHSDMDVLQDDTGEVDPVALSGAIGRGGPLADSVDGQQRGFVER